MGDRTEQITEYVVMLIVGTLFWGMLALSAYLDPWW